MIKAGIVGGAGYTGGELIRILLHHPAVHISFVQSESSAGKPISSVHQDLLGETQMNFTAKVQKDVDVLFFCTGHGTSQNLISSIEIDPTTRIIDLSNDFRLKPHHIAGKRSFVYGLPEINHDVIASADSVSNPGCFASAIQLAILPLIDGGHLNEFYVTGITGSTGAGQSLSPTTHFSWRSNNIQAYKALTHQHMGEINQSIAQISKNEFYPAVHFVPWRGDFARGIFISAQTKSELNLEQIEDIYHKFYQKSPFVFLVDQAIHLKQVVNTNKCLIQIEKEDDQLVIHSVLDNLVKGASGQAVQNMNIMFGLDERTGLLLKASAF